MYRPWTGHLVVALADSRFAGVSFASFYRPMQRAISHLHEDQETWAFQEMNEYAMFSLCLPIALFCSPHLRWLC